MIMQEGFAKELLESMGRIEAPIFEGDETFSKNYFDNLKLNSNNDNDKFLEKCYRDRCLKIISYSRLINSKWSSKGIIPLEMSLYSHNKLQKFIQNLIKMVEMSC